MSGSRRVYRWTIGFWAAAGAALLLFLGGPARAVRVTIFHTNDMHGWISPHGSGAGATGGMGALAAYLAKQTKPYLLLDAGDIFQGTPEGNFTHGEAVVDCMNAAGYAAAAVGNHDFDEGVDTLAKLAGSADFPFLAANVHDARTPPRLSKVKPWIIQDVNGVRVGVFGLLTARTPKMSFAKNVADVEFEDETAAARRAVAELRENGAQIVVALTHLGWERPSPAASTGTAFGDAELAKAVPGIDLIVGGHSHTALFEARKVENTFVVQAGSQLRWVGRTVLRWDLRDNRLIDVADRLIPLDISRWGQESNMQSLVKYYRQTVSESMGADLDEVVGYLETPLTRSYDGESTSGDWHADVIRASTTTVEIAFHNSGGIRYDLDAGSVSARDVFLVAPFGNAIVTMWMKGYQIKSVLEHSVSGDPGLLQVSGLRMEYDPDQPEGRRVTSVLVGDKALVADRYYRVATNDFLAQGGDGYDAFKEAHSHETGRTVLSALLRDLRKNSPKKVELDGRIKRTGAP